MRTRYWLLYILLCGTVLLYTSCGRKGDPIIPVIPQPLPVQNVSGEIDDNSIILSWALPLEYDNGKPLELKDIKTFTVFRKTEVSEPNNWDFPQTSEGWTAAGKTLPIKWHKGLLRAASKQNLAFILSPKDLSIDANNARYIRLKLWSKNSDRGYITFTTKEDTKWDTNTDLRFQPAVHTSFYTYQRIFNPLKLKSFQIPSVSEGIKGDFAREYVIDMGRVSSWKGVITQIGIILRNSDPEHATVELGLDRVELTNTLEERASIYESSPWLFLEDEEGWRSNHPGGVFGAAGGVLYTQGSESVVLMSSPGQSIKLSDVRQIQVRMKVTSGDSAYLVLGTQDEPLQSFTGITPDISSNMLPFALTDNTDFHTYTIDLTDDLTEPFVNEGYSNGPPKKDILSQIGIFFPALGENPDRHILIDYIYILDSSAEPSILLPFLIQKDIPSIDEIEQQVRQKISQQDPEFDVPYDDLPANPERASDKPLKLVEISPEHPDPAIIKEGKFYLTDTGKFSEDDTKDATLHHGERYTYTIELTDRKKRESGQPGSVTIEFIRIPTAPYNLQVKPGDEENLLTWNRPFLTIDGKKIKSLTGYNIFRSVEPGQYPNVPISQVSPNTTTFLDKNLSNGVTYSYIIQSVGTATPVIRGRDFSPEVLATPVDNIPPDIPTGLAGIYMGKTVKLFWNAVQAKDSAGFNIYRSEDPAKGFSKINPQPILQASYQDTTVVANQRYSYYVTSFDNAVPPNESQPSKVMVVETVALE
jgi:hypothetical protein